MVKRKSARAAVVTLGLSAIYVVLIVKLASLQLIKYPSLSSRARDQHLFTVKLEPRRGNILDISGRPIALSLEAWSMYAHPYKLKDRVKTASCLSAIIGLDKGIILKKLESDAPFVWIKRKLGRNEREAIEELKFEGIGFIEEARRYYPHGSLGANIIGFTGMDNNGLEGIEKRFDAILSGFAGRYEAERDAKGREISSYIFRLIKPMDGASIYLTIDNVIQNIAEECLGDAIKKAQAKGGAAIVINPSSGEILAMASYETFDPNLFADFPPASYRNHAISLVFEPGSTFKTITAAIALEEALFKTEDKIYCEDGAIRIGGHIIHDHHPHTWLTFSETVEKSSNIGLLKIGQKIGRELFYEYARKFGFGKETQVELPGEEKGIVPALGEWRPVTVATISFGQGIAVTPIQMVRAYSAIANGGVLQRPSLVKKIISSEGIPFKKFFAGEGERILSEDTALRLKGILKRAVENGTGSSAKIDGLDIAGKTGTAQKVSPGGGYSEDKYVASFIGFMPLDEPKILIGVFIDEPRGIHYGGIVAAPCFREMAKRIFSYLRIKQPDERIYMSSSYEKAQRLSQAIRD